MYGGCLEKKNNFKTLDACNSLCRPKNQPSASQRAGDPRPGAGNNADGEDPYLQDGSEVTWRFQGIPQAPSAPATGPRSASLSDGASGDGSSGNGESTSQNT